MTLTSSILSRIYKSNFYSNFVFIDILGDHGRRNWSERKCHAASPGLLFDGTSESLWSIYAFLRLSRAIACIIHSARIWIGSLSTIGTLKRCQDVCNTIRVFSHPQIIALWKMIPGLAVDRSIIALFLFLHNFFLYLFHVRILFFQTDFWSCVNSTLNGKYSLCCPIFIAREWIPSHLNSDLELQRNENWIGRRCCHLVQNPTCRTTCAVSGSTDDLNQSCRPSDEPEFFFCLEKREEAERCCSNVSNDTCRTICKNIFYKPGSKQSNLKLYSSKGCFYQIPKCLKNIPDVKHTDDPKQR